MRSNHQRKRFRGSSPIRPAAPAEMTLDLPDEPAERMMHARFQLAVIPPEEGSRVAPTTAFTWSCMAALPFIAVRRAIALQLIEQRLEADSEDFGGACLVVLGVLQGQFDQRTFRLIDG